MNKKKMLGTIGAVALTLGTAGCGTADNQVVENPSSSQFAEMQEDCDELELVSGDPYSGSDKEVWYCDDDNDGGSHVSGMFFYPFYGGYYNASTMKSKHNVDVSSYKPGTTATKVSASQYNKAAKVKLPSYKGSGSSVKSGAVKSGTVKSNSSSSKSSSGKVSSGSSSKGFGSSFSSSGG